MFKQYLFAFFVSIVITIILLLTTVAIIIVEVVFEKLRANGVGVVTESWVSVGQYLLLLFMIFLTVSILFFFSTKEGKEMKFFSAGSFLTTLLVVSSFYLFGFYVQKFSKYNELYGSIGTILIMMLFIWINCIILLLGFELNLSIKELRKLKKKI